MPIAKDEHTAFYTEATEALMQIHARHPTVELDHVICTLAWITGFWIAKSPNLQGAKRIANINMRKGIVDNK